MRDNERPNAGWTLEDRHYLRKTDPSSDPAIQILTEEDLEEEEPEQRQYWCAICKARLDFLKETGTIWRCNECMQYYDTSIQDVPVKDIRDTKVKAFPELDHYPTADEDDVWLPFVQGVDPDADEQDIPRNIEVISDDGRHKHIRVKGLPTEALAAMNELDDKT
jgi:hypothetical protein